MRKIILLLLIFLLSTTFSQDQSIYIPLNVKNAIEKGTRTMTGLPGPNYWQNKSIYKINVELSEDSSMVLGEETITYFNNSPDSLRELVMRLYSDISKKGAVRDWYYNKKYLNDGVTLKYLIINDDSLDVSESSNDIYRGSTNMRIRLKKKMSPKSQMTIKTGWEFEIPKEMKLRMGNYGDGNFYIAYWYPQMAVYDDIDGWDLVDYSGIVEFYNDFSDYEVNIKVPKGMVVWATGDLINAESMLRKDIYEKYEKAKISDETVRIIEQDDYKKGLVTAENDFNVWKFTAVDVTDFTFATTRSFNWDGASVVVDKETGRRTLTDVIYEDNTIHYDNGVQYARATVKYLSEELPGFPFPYSHATSYSNGSRGGGMESPMIANNGAPSNLGEHVGLVFHEISHNYFPFMMGTNERKYAWMDEGWAAMLPTNVVDRYDSDFDYKSQRVELYEKDAGSESDLPLVTLSYSYSTRAIRLGFYDRPANAYYALEEYLGTDLFKECMIEYMNRWKGKHPLPHDFFLTFNELANEDLSWFWRPWFYEYGYPDLALVSVKHGNGEVNAEIKKTGNIPTRIELNFEFEDGSVQTVSKPASVWKNGKDIINVKLKTDKNVVKARLGSKYIPDVKDENNFMEIKAD